VLSFLKKNSPDAAASGLIKELFSNRYKLKIPVKILVEKKTSKEKYDKIKDVSFEKS